MLEPKNPSVSEVRGRIERISVEKYRIAFMYQYLIGAEVSEVCGDFAPKKNNSFQVNYDISGQEIPGIVFLVPNIKPQERGSMRACALPLDSNFEPWANKIYEYFKKFGNEYPFTHNKRTHQEKAKQIFEGFMWEKGEYWQNRNIQRRRYNPFRSQALRKLRMKSLSEQYYFNDIDLALYGAWNEYPRGLNIRSEVEKILSNKYVLKDKQVLIELTKRYFGKLLKPIASIDQEHVPFYIQSRDDDDLRKRYQRTTDICTLVRQVNESGQAKIQTSFFKENMWIVLEMLSMCENEAQFTSKIAGLSALFRIDLQQWKNVIEDLSKDYDFNLLEGRGSIRHVEEWLRLANIQYNTNMITSWDYITTLRNFEPIHRTNPEKLREIYQYFGLPLTYPRDYTDLWEIILDRFHGSLIELRNILNNIP